MCAAGTSNACNADKEANRQVQRTCSFVRPSSGLGPARLTVMALNQQLATDKRRWERRLVNVPIRVVAGDLTGTRVEVARSTKISEGGICLFVLANLAIGDRIGIELADSDSGIPVRV